MWNPSFDILLPVTLNKLPEAELFISPIKLVVVKINVGDSGHL